MIPRQKGCKGLHQIDYTLKHFYTFYKKETRDNIKNRASRKVYGDIIKEINKEIIRLIIEESASIKIPNIGYLSISPRVHKPIKDGELNKNYLIVNWKATWDYWKSKYPNVDEKDMKTIKNKKLVYYENSHTRGITYYFILSKRFKTIGPGRMYKFIPTTSNKYLLNLHIKNNPNHRYYGN